MIKLFSPFTFLWYYPEFIVGRIRGGNWGDLKQWKLRSILNPSILLMTPHLYRRSHTYTGHACPKSPSGRLSIQGQTVLTQAVNQQLWYHLLGESEGETPGRSYNNENWVNPYKRMTPPSTQNLKALGLWVFFLICCSAFSFLPNVGLRLTLEYLTISPSSVRPSSTLIHSLSSGSINPSTLLMTSYLYHRSYTYTGYACLKSPSGRLSIQGQIVLAQAAN